MNDDFSYIIAHCDESDRLANAATAGEWGIERTTTNNWIGPMRQSGDGKIHTIVVHTDREGLTVSSLAQNDANADFIAAARTIQPRQTKALREMTEALNRAAIEGAANGVWAESPKARFAAEQLAALRATLEGKE